MSPPFTTKGLAPLFVGAGLLDAEVEGFAGVSESVDSFVLSVMSLASGAVLGAAASGVVAAAGCESDADGVDVTGAGADEFGTEFVGFAVGGVAAGPEILDSKLPLGVERP